MAGARPQDIHLARLALDVLALDGAGMGGLHLRARAGPARDAVMARLSALPPSALSVRRIHPNVDDVTLFGGTDLAATLAAGKLHKAAGILAAPAALILMMAERATAGLAARLSLHLDAGSSCLIALDEGVDADEGLCPSLAERLGLFLDLTPFDLEDAQALAERADISAARACWPQMRRQGLTVAQMRALAEAAGDLGIDSARAPLFAARAAVAIAALRGLGAVDAACLQDAAALCFAHRAAPQSPDEEPAPEPPQSQPDAPREENAAPSESDVIPSDIVLEAVRAALPADVLARITAGRAARAAMGSAGTGAKVKGNHRGRPLPAQAGRPRTGQRIDILSTLRAAAPFQTLRAAASGQPRRLAIRTEDLRIKRYQHSSDRVLIFTVDASGSSAFARLAEAKGAVELLLAQSYARRDHVALLAFRGQECQMVLPPTRALTAAKRRLAELAGGGGTPLAAGLRMGLDVARQARARGMTPTLALLTDGRGNIALDGSVNRAAAEVDAARMAQMLASAGIPALVIDIGQRALPALAELARSMGAVYVPLPRADAQRLSRVLQASLGQ